MAKPVIFVSATIVLFFMSWTGWGAPLPEVPDGPPPEAEAPATPPGDEVVISPSPAPQAMAQGTSDPHYYPYRQQLSFRAGQSGDLSLKDFNDPVFGFQYLFPGFLSPKLEAGADLHGEGNGHVHVGIRWIRDERLYFRPSVKIGLDHRAEAKDGLATLIHFENYFARLSATLEYVFWSPYSVRLEPELLVGFEKPVVVVTLGLSRGW
jgi:hypothetical protein